MILDTNGLSAIADGDMAIEPIVSKAALVAIPVIVLGEYRYGILRSRNREYYQKWLDDYLGRFRILEVVERTTVFYGAVRSDLSRVGRPIPSNDLWIAALCRQHSLPLLSRDRHFDAVPGITRIAW